MNNKLFEKAFDAWNLASVVSRVWGPESDKAKAAQAEFYKLLNSMNDETKLNFFEFLKLAKARIEKLN